MIDIVFQLLVFFVMTFKIVSLEGDFNVRMPLDARPTDLESSEQLPPMVVRLIAASDGDLERIQLNDRDFGVDFDGLHQHVISVLGNDRGPGSAQQQAVVELDCDYGLNYEHVIHAVTAVSGYIDSDGNTVALVEQIKLAPPRQTAS
jgi:biopolymer transport protein ExbD